MGISSVSSCQKLVFAKTFVRAHCTMFQLTKCQGNPLLGCVVVAEAPETDN